MTNNPASLIIQIETNKKHHLKGDKKMSRAEIRMEQEREQMLNELITKYGFESEPTLYFAKYAWKDLYNSHIYFETAINWHFIED